MKKTRLELSKKDGEIIIEHTKRASDEELEQILQRPAHPDSLGFDLEKWCAAVISTYRKQGGDTNLL